jgi:SAM-dependent methyltransferase
MGTSRVIMGLKDSPENEFEQTVRADCLRRWYAGPQGAQILDALIREIASHCVLHFGDSLLELSPVSLVPKDRFGSAWTIRLGSEASDLRAEAHRLPLPAESFSCVILAHTCSDGDRAQRVIAEAARVLAPEGRLFLLESGSCPAARGGTLRASLPVGLQRGTHRRWVQQAGLSVRRQLALSLLSSRLPNRWHRALARVDRMGAPLLPALGSCVLTVAQRREVMPLSLGARWRSSRVPVRAAGGSQWA